MRSQVVQWDIHATDAVTQRRFYSSVFGWRCSHPDDPDQYGWMMDQDGSMLGGIGQARPEETSGLSFFVQVDDVAATVARAEQLGGGTYWGPLSFDNGMVTACISDPRGNGVLLIEPSRDGEPYASFPPVTTFAWTWDIQTPEPDSLASFYQSLFGWTWTGLGDQGWGRLEPGKDGGPEGGITRDDIDRVIIAIHVDDPHATAAAFEREGGSVLRAPHHIGGSLNIATCIDPEGNHIGLFHFADAEVSEDREPSVATG